ncbi:MAG: hypothetical protein AB8F26_04185 [Phycisphaerales bacterium]
MTKLFLAAFVLYTAVLVMATHWPGVKITGPVPRPDLFIHLGAFSVWTVLLGLSGLIGRCPKRLVIWAAVFVVVDETTQPILGRHFDWLDLVANFGGVLIGLVVMSLVWRGQARNPKPFRG